MQRQKQVPFVDDNQKGNCNDNGKSKSNYDCKSNGDELAEVGGGFGG